MKDDILLRYLREIDKGNFIDISLDGELKECGEILNRLSKELLFFQQKEIVYNNRFTEIEEVLYAYLRHDYSKKCYISNEKDNIDALSLSVNLFGNELEESFRTITQQKEDLINSTVSKNELEKANKEISLLLKEVHHRVKNNLQIIVSLIELQFGTEEEKSVSGILELGNRVKSMSVIHEILYQTENFSEIIYQDYLEELLTSIRKSFSNNKCNVEIEIDVDKEISFDLEISIPLGLLINEIVTNSFKYAFKGKVEGLISISMIAVNDAIVIIIKDDGVGFDTNQFYTNKRGGPLGAKLIKALSKQIRATVDIENDGGTQFTLTIPINDN